MRSKSTKYIIGIDEAGRGPLAGPVVVGGIKIGVKRKAQSKKLFRNIRDSKKLSAKQREEWFRLLTNHPKVEWAVAGVWPTVIDRINIARAADLGVLRVYRKFCSASVPRSVPRQFRDPDFVSAEQKRNKIRNRIGRTKVLLDGSLKLPRHISHEVIIKGDERVPIIAAASIIAKVIRDRTMLRLHKKYPQYGFDVHKGYGTKLHRKMVKKFGRSEVHRKSFRI